MPAVPSIAFPFKGSDNATYSGQTVPLDAAGAVPNSLADGSSITLGAKADSAYADATLAASGSLIGLTKGVFGALKALLSVDTVVKAGATSRSGLSTAKAASAAVTTGGSGYAAGDTVTNAAGLWTVSTVASGAVTAVAATTPAVLTATPSGALAQTATSGSGTGCTLTPAFTAAAAALAPSNANRRGFSIQNQSTDKLWFNGIGSATADQNSFLLNPGDYFATDAHHVGTGAISIIGTGAGQAFYAREF